MYFKFADHIFIIQSGDIEFLPTESSLNPNFIFYDAVPVAANLKKVIINFTVKNFEIDGSYTEIPGPIINGWALFKNDSEYVFRPKYYESKFCIWYLQIKKDFSAINVYSGEEFVKEVSGKKTIKDIFKMPLLQLLIMHYMIKLGGVLVHSSGIKIADKGFIFPGVSGAGKSTVARFLVRNCAAKGFSDERNIILESPEGFNLYGTPWVSSANIGNDDQAPLAGIVFVKQSEGSPILRRMPVSFAISKLFQVSSVPWYDQGFVNITADIIEKIVTQVPAYEFSYKPGIEAVHAFNEFAINRDV